MAAAAAAAAAAASNPTPSSVMYYGHAPHPEHHTPANGELDKSEEQIYESIYDTRWRLMNQVGLKLMLIRLVVWTFFWQFKVSEFAGILRFLAFFLEF